MEYNLFKFSNISRNQIDSHSLKIIVISLIFYDFAIKKFKLTSDDIFSNINEIENNLNYKIFARINFNDIKFGETVEDRIAYFNTILNEIRKLNIDYSNSNIVSDAYEYFLKIFATNSKKGGEFYTPVEVSKLIKEIIKLNGSYNNIYDPTCGTGSLLINCAEKGNKLFGQEINNDSYNLAIMNMIMQGNDYDIKCGNTLLDPRHIDCKFDAIVSNPPFSVKWTPPSIDIRFITIGNTTAPNGKADLAFVQHCLYHLNDNGIACIVLFPGVLYRGGKEQKIREYLIKNNLIDCIITLPENIFYGTNISTALVIFKKNKKDNNILYIDATDEFKKGKKNVITDNNISNIIDLYKNRSCVDNKSKVYTLDEIKDLDYHLQFNIKQYNEEQIDIDSIEKELEEIDKKIILNIQKHREFMKQLKGLVK